MARLRLAEAEGSVNAAKARARVAKRRRKEARQAARRARKQVKRAKAALVEAKQALADAQKQLARKSEKTTKAGTSVKARRTVKAPASRPKVRRKTAPSRRSGKVLSSAPGAVTPATSSIPIVPKSRPAEAGSLPISDADARANSTQSVAARAEEAAARDQQTQ